MFTPAPAHDQSLDPTPAAHAIIARYAAQQITEIAPTELSYTIFDDAENRLAVGFYDTNATRNWVPIRSCPTLDELGLLCLEATNAGRFVIVTKLEAKKKGLLDEEAVADDLDLRLDIPRQREWCGDDWRELISNGEADLEDEDDSDAVSQISLNADQDADELDLRQNLAWLDDED